METKEIGWHMDFHSLKTIYEVLMYDHCLEVLNILLAVLTSCFNEMCKTKKCLYPIVLYHLAGHCMGSIVVAMQFLLLLCQKLCETTV